jgi:hypothetical protein
MEVRIDWLSAAVNLAEECEVNADLDLRQRQALERLSVRYFWESIGQSSRSLDSSGARIGASGGQRR